MNHRVLQALLALFTLLALAPAAAHELRPSLLVMNESAPGVYEVRLTVSSVGASRVYLTPQFPDRCEALAPTTTVAGPGTETQRTRIDCGESLDGQVVQIDGLDGTVNDVLVRVQNVDGSVQTARVLPESPQFEVLGAQSMWDVGLAYGTLGMHHILLGLDHLLFVLALLLLIRSVRTLVATITAFTAAHSVTLVLSALGLANAPQVLVEALVALSIVFVAVEIVKTERGDADAVALSPWRLAFVFGLLHGLGFGGALAEIGLPEGDVPLALLAFNIGVEAGQLLIVALAIATVASLKRLLALGMERGRGWLGYGIGTVSATWFAQRAWGILAGVF